MGKIKGKVIRSIFDRYRDIIPEYEYFLDTILKRPLRAIRFNTLHHDIEEIYSYLENEYSLEKIDWCKYAYYLKNNSDIGRSVYHETGLFYIQSVASLLPPILLRPEKKDVVFDAAAAPGGKTTHMAQIMENSGTIIANDNNRRRIRKLIRNIERLGVTNTVVTCIDARDYPRILGLGKVLLDAPCSNESLVYKMDMKALKVLNNRKIYERYSVLQKQIVNRMAAILEKGDRLLYSVCTFAPEEAEAVTDYAIDKGFRAIKISVPLKHTRGIEEWRINGKRTVFCSEVGYGLRVYPHLNYEDYQGNVGFLYISLLERC